MHKLVLLHGRTLSALLALCFLSLCGTAQELMQRPNPASQPELQITTRLVVLDVVVTDHSGQLRNDLTANDFHITEDGVPQTILNFEPPSSHPIPVGAPITSTKDLESRAPQSPVDIVVLDEVNTSFQNMAFARYALKKYLNAQPSTMQAPTMLIAVNFDKFTVLHDYTQNRAEILSALDHHLTHYPWNMERGESKYITFAKSLGALEQVAEGTRGHLGHKNIVWVGKGFPGIDLSSPAISQEAVAGVTYAMQQAVNMLRDSRVTLYTIDPTLMTATIATTSDADSVLGGMDGGMDATAPDPFVGDVNFTGLAKATGGKSFYSRNDVDREIGESVRDGVNYYTIAYRPTDSSDATRDYRKIRVAFANKGLHAFYRDGYFAKTTEAAAAIGPRTKYDLAAAEESTMVYTGLSVVVAAKPGAPDTYVVGVPESQLTWTGDGDRESARLKLVAAAVNNQSEVLRRSTEEITAHRQVKADMPTDTRGLVRVEVTLPSGPKTYRLRFVVYSEGDGRLGTADILIPGAAPGKNIR